MKSPTTVNQHSSVKIDGPIPIYVNDRFTLLASLILFFSFA